MDTGVCFQQTVSAAFMFTENGRPLELGTIDSFWHVHHLRLLGIIATTSKPARLSA